MGFIGLFLAEGHLAVRGKRREEQTGNRKCDTELFTLQTDQPRRAPGLIRVIGENDATGAPDIDFRMFRVQIFDATFESHHALSPESRICIIERCRNES